MFYSNYIYILGAVGIEVAAEIKHKHPDKNTILIHPHGFLPPEPDLPENFKKLTYLTLLQMGVNVILNKRIKTDDKENKVVITTDGDRYKSDLTVSCYLI